MISELDETIRRLLIDRGGLDPTEIDIRFEIPDRDWAASISRPTVNCYLFDLHENRQLRAAGTSIDRNGRMARVSKPPWRINLSYLITAWTKAVEDEHRLLWQVLHTLALYSELPRELLQGALANVELEIPTSVAQPDGGPLRSPGEFWSALENKLKPSVNYVITLPLEVAAPVDTPFVLSPLQIRWSLLGTPPTGASQGGDEGGPGAPGNGHGPSGAPSGGHGPAGAPGDGQATTDRSAAGRSRRGASQANRSPRTDVSTASSEMDGQAVPVGGIHGANNESGLNTATVREASGYTITGAVRDASGAIIKTARVFFLTASSQVRPAGFRGGGHYSATIGRPEGIGFGRGIGTDQSVITTCEGAFTLFTVPAGTYWVGVQLPGQPLRRCAVTVPAATYDLTLDDVQPD